VVAYDLGSTLKKSGHGFGTDQRFKIAGCEKEKHRSPPPGSYDLKSDFEAGRAGTAGHTPKKQVYSFGIGREHFKKVYLPAVQTFNLDPNCPGPGMYAV